MDKANLVKANEISTEIRKIEDSVSCVKKATKIGFKDNYGEFFYQTQHIISKDSFNVITKIVISELNIELAKKEAEFNAL